MKLGKIKGFYITKSINTICESTHNFRELLIEKLDDFLHDNWGNICPEDQEANRWALETGSRVIGSYTINRTKIWIIAEPKDDNGIREAVTILLPEEY